MKQGRNVKIEYKQTIGVLLQTKLCCYKNSKQRNSGTALTNQQSLGLWSWNRFPKEEWTDSYKRDES